MSKYPKCDDLDNLEQKILKYLWVNVSVDMSIRNREKLEEEMYRKFAVAFTKMYRKMSNKIVDVLINTAEELKQDD